MIFIDTGAFIAKYVLADQFHVKSVHMWSELEKKKVKIVTSNFILDETLTLLARQTNYDFSAKIARIIYQSNVINILRPTHDTELRALVLFDKFSDQKVSFTDCISFQLMKEHRINMAFSFDRHFVLAGFDVRPESLL